MNNLTPEIYFAKLKLDNNLSNAQFQKIRLAHVTIVGVGGLGCAAALELCSFGVNTIKLIDGDRVEAHNLYRQTLFNTQHCGLNKALVAQEILQNKFPFSQIEAQPNFLNLHNAQTFIQKTDLIIDCTDRLEMRYLINDVAVLNNLPWIFAGINGSTAQLACFNVNNSADFRSVFPKSSTLNFNCNVQGVLPFVPSILGSFQAVEAFKLITGVGKPLINQVKIIDMINQISQIIEIKPNTNEIEIIKKNGFIPKPEYGEFSGKKDVTELTWTEFYNTIKPSDSIYAIDNLPDDFAYFHQLVYTNTTSSDRLFFICNSGKTSYSLALQTKANYPEKEVFSILGGLKNYKPKEN